MLDLVLAVDWSEMWNPVFSMFPFKIIINVEVIWVPMPTAKRPMTSRNRGDWILMMSGVLHVDLPGTVLRVMDGVVFHKLPTTEGAVELLGKGSNGLVRVRCVRSS